MSLIANRSVRAFFPIDPNPPPPPPSPPNPNITYINNGVDNNFRDEYQIFNNVSVENPVLLNDLYSTRNRNPIPPGTLLNEVFFQEKYVSGRQSCISYRDTSLSISGVVNFYFWLFPFYSQTSNQPITVFTKGLGNNPGEYTCQINTSRRLVFSYRTQNSIVSILSNSIIPEKKLTYVTIIKTTSTVAIYLNSIRDSIISSNSAANITNNPFIIGSGYNGLNYNGVIDNLIITTVTDDPLTPMNIYYNIPPLSLQIFFQNGLITYISDPKLLNNLDTTKYICNLLENFANGFYFDKTVNKYYYFVGYKSYTAGLSNLYLKYKTLYVNNTSFSRLNISYKYLTNARLKDINYANDYYLSMNGEIYYFRDGEAFTINPNTGVLTPINVNNNIANYIISSIEDIVCYRFAFQKYLFYTFVCNFYDNDCDELNNVVNKINNFVIGGTNSVVEFAYQMKAGPVTSYNNIRNIDNYQGITMEKYISPSDNYNIIPIENIPDKLVQNESLIVKQILPIQSYNGDNSSYIHIFDNGFVPIINQPLTVLPNRCPKFLDEIPIYFKLDDNMNICDYLGQSAKPGSLVYTYLKPELSPGFYIISAITSTKICLIINEKETRLTENIQQYIVIHKSNKPIEISAYFNYVGITQVFMLRISPYHSL